MRILWSVPTILLLCALGVVAEDISGIPTCAYGCFLDAFDKSGCSLSDTICQCTTGAQTIANSVTPCVNSACSQKDAGDSMAASAQICKKTLAGAGVTSAVVLPSAQATSGAVIKMTAMPPSEGVRIERSMGLVIAALGVGVVLL